MFGQQKILASAAIPACPKWRVFSFYRSSVENVILSFGNVCSHSPNTFRTFCLFWSGTMLGTSLFSASFSQFISATNADFAVMLLGLPWNSFPFVWLFPRSHSFLGNCYDYLITLHKICSAFGVVVFNIHCWLSISTDTLALPLTFWVVYSLFW